MLNQNTRILENEILRILQFSQRGLTASDISSKVEARWKTYSSRGIYKELNRLEREGIILKSRSLYTLRLAWLITTQSEIEEMIKAATNPKLLKDFLPVKNKDLLIHCTDLIRFDQIWTQLMLAQHKLLPSLPMFIWTPRHWFNLTHPEIDDTFVKANELSKNLRYLIVGGRGLLDKRDKDQIARKSTGYSFKISPFEYDRTRSYWVIGDYIGTATLSKRNARMIDKIYEETKKLSDLPTNIKKYLLSQSCKGNVRLEFEPQKAQKFRQKFLDFFNIHLNKDGELTEILRGEL